MGACHHVPDPAFTQLREALELAADLRVQLAKAGDASDRAVMADTDETSVAFAHEAEATIKTVEADVGALAARLHSLGFQNETRLLDEFSQRFTEYRAFDRGVLELAVENTNLKAQHLSFGPIRKDADAFRDSLAELARTTPIKDRCRAESLAAHALLAVRDVQVLQAPHIAEPDDAAMDRLEKEMAGLQASAHDALAALAELAGPKQGSALAAANVPLAQFDRDAAALVKLSRRNSNVRSLSLSLRQKPALAAACDVSLAALNLALGKEGGGATR